MATANIDTESSLVAPGGFIAGVDEVGRGALAGPVVIGVVVIDPRACAQVPTGLTDSKLLSPKRREGFVPVVQEWAHEWGVGEASPEEIDELGIMTAMALAAQRALLTIDTRVDAVLLDGSVNWLARSAAFWAPKVTTKVKADITCASVSAAGVLAKVHRDALMVAASDEMPEYGWAGNKGYGSADHRSAIAEFGASDFHRLSWRLLPGDEGDEPPEDDQPSLFD
ncbi:MAG: ribonuclease HII [Actinomycetes bacterium]